MLWGRKAHAPQLLSLSSRPHEPWNEPVLEPRDRPLQQEKLQKRSLCTTASASSPLLLLAKRAECSIEAQHSRGAQKKKKKK